MHLVQDEFTSSISGLGSTHNTGFTSPPALGSCLFTLGKIFSTPRQKMLRVLIPIWHSLPNSNIQACKNCSKSNLWSCEASLHAPAPKSTRRQPGSRQSRCCRLETTCRFKTRIVFSHFPRILPVGGRPRSTRRTLRRASSSGCLSSCSPCLIVCNQHMSFKRRLLIALIFNNSL